MDAVQRARLVRGHLERKQIADEDRIAARLYAASPDKRAAYKLGLAKRKKNILRDRWNDGRYEAFGKEIDRVHRLNFKPRASKASLNRSRRRAKVAAMGEFAKLKNTRAIAAEIGAPQKRVKPITGPGDWR